MSFFSPRVNFAGGNLREIFSPAPSFSSRLSPPRPCPPPSPSLLADAGRSADILRGVEPLLRGVEPAMPDVRLRVYL